MSNFIKFPSFKYLFMFIILSMIIVASCSSDDSSPMVEPEPEEMDPCDGIESQFARDVQPIINASCALAGCHVAGGGAPGDFEDYAGVSGRSGGIVARAVVAGNMPPASSSAPSLNAEQKLLIQCWVESGAMDN